MTHSSTVFLESRVMAEEAEVTVDTKGESGVCVTQSSENASLSTVHEVEDARRLVADLERAIAELEDEDDSGPSGGHHAISGP